MTVTISIQERNSYWTVTFQVDRIEYESLVTLLTTKSSSIVVSSFGTRQTLSFRGIPEVRSGALYALFVGVEERSLRGTLADTTFRVKNESSWTSNTLFGNFIPNASFTCDTSVVEA